MELKLKSEKQVSVRQLVDQNIPFSEVLLLGVSEDEQTKEIISKQEALKRAQQAGLNLVCIAPKSDPPVCKIMDYQKHLFNLRKKTKAQKKNGNKNITKEIKVNFHIGEGDLETKINQIKEWLENGGCLVRVKLKMAGREKEHKELVKEKCQKIIENLQERSEKIKLQGEIKLQGNIYSFLLQKSK